MKKNIYPVIFITVAIILIGLIIFLVLKNKKHSKENLDVVPTSPPFLLPSCVQRPDDKFEQVVVDKIPNFFTITSAKPGQTVKAYITLPKFNLTISNKGCTCTSKNFNYSDNWNKYKQVWLVDSTFDVSSNMPGVSKFKWLSPPFVGGSSIDYEIDTSKIDTSFVFAQIFKLPEDTSLSFKFLLYDTDGNLCSISETFGAKNPINSSPPIGNIPNSDVFSHIYAYKNFPIWCKYLYYNDEPSQAGDWIGLYRTVDESGKPIIPSKDNLPLWRTPATELHPGLSVGEITTISSPGGNCSPYIIRPKDLVVLYFFKGNTYDIIDTSNVIDYNQLQEFVI